MPKKRKPDQLDIDSTAAIKAGMSYGKYMATKTPAKAAPPELHGVRCECECCGEVFYKQRAQKFCSDACREKYYKRKEKKPLIKTCAICGKEFVAATWRNKYCSQFCIQVAQNERVKEYQARKKAKEAGSDELEI